MSKSVIATASVAVLLVIAIFTRGFGLIGDEAQELKLYGNVDIRQVELSFRVPGRIVSIAYEEGAKVPEGAIIAQLEPTTFNDSLLSARAQLAQANAELARARNGNRSQDIERARAAVAEQQALVSRYRADLARRQSLLPSGAVSEAAVNASRADLATAEARLHSAQEALSLQLAGNRIEDIQASEARQQAATAQVSRARTDLADTAVRAPVAGVVLTRAFEPGSTVQASQVVVTLAIDRPMRVRAYIAADDLSRVSPGMNVLVTTNGNQKIYHGTIGFISPTAEFTPKTVQTEQLRSDLVYRVRIIVTDPDDALRQGQPVTITIPSARAAAKD